MNDENYLKSELYQRITEDPSIFDFLQEAVLDGLWYWDVESPEHEWMNSRFWSLLGFEAEEKKHLSSEWKELIFPEDLDAATENFQKHCEDPSHPYDQVVRYRHKDGSTVWVRCRGVAIRDDQGKPVRMLGAHLDLTPQMKQREHLAKKNKELDVIARHDSLTGLYNRRAFEELLTSKLVQADKESQPISLVMLDIDHFKAINDEYGHDAGDEVLQSIGAVLEGAARSSDIVARIGGEEFAVILFGSSVDDALGTAERYRKNIEDYVWHKENITVSAGCSTYIHISVSDQAYDVSELAEILLREADMALYFSKRNGRNCANHYNNMD